MGPAAEILSADRSWVRLDLSRVVIDTKEFDRYLSGGAESMEARSKALALYSGPLLPEQSEDWVQAERQEYHAKHLSALIEQTDALLAAERTEDALAFALRAVRSDPYHEPARMAAIRCFVEVGDLGGAVRQYVEYEKAIVREFSARPSEAMQRLVASIRDKKASVPTEAPAREEAPSLAMPTHLPVYLDRLVGREQEQALLKGWLSADPRQRLVTITGPGGVGKTRVATATAEAIIQSFGGQVTFVGLADMESGQKVLDRVQEAFGTSSPSAKEPLPGWGAKPCLLVMDNLEHVLEDANRAIREILHSHPGVCVLATSRQRLGLGGEQELPLPPLALPELSKGAPVLDSSPAAELFLERSRAVRPEYSIPQDEVESLTMLLARLDGLPLAIELAAARIGFLTPDQMLSEIDDMFTFLVSRRADSGPRQRSLRATIEWSFSGLSENLKEALGLFSVFRGGWSVEAARQATGRADVLELLQDLIDRSLIYKEETPYGARFGMLETIRDYALTELPEAKAKENRRIHSQVTARVVYAASRTLIGPLRDKSYETIRAEMDNIRAAIDWTIEHDRHLSMTLGASIWRFLCARGVPSEGVTLFDRILTTPLPDDSEELGETLLGRGRIAVAVGDMAGASNWLVPSIEVFQRLELPTRISWARLNLSHAKLEGGRVREAYELTLLGMDGAKESNRPLIKGVMARCLARMGRLEEAMEAAEDVFATTVGKPDGEHSGRAFFYLANTYMDCGRTDSAYGLIQESLERLRPLRLQQMILASQILAAREELRMGNWDAFDATVGEARTRSVELSDEPAQVTLACLEARKLAGMGQFVEAFRMYESAIRRAEIKSSALTFLLAARMLAHDLAQGGQVEAAVEALAAEIGLREHLDCGLTRPEAAELAHTISLTGEVAARANVHSVEDLLAKVLAITAQVR